MNYGAVLSEKELKAKAYLYAYSGYDFFRKISERDKKIFESRIGYGGLEPKSFNELAKIFGLTKQSCQYTVIKICKKIGRQVGAVVSHQKICTGKRLKTCM